MENRTIITNARIWTGNSDLPWSEALVIEGNKIVYTGDCKGAEAFAVKGTKIIDAGGKMVMPSFIDSHTHLTAVAKSKWCFLLEQKPYGSVEEILEIVKQYADKTPVSEQPYIYAYSCPTELMGREGVNRYLMDRYISDRPVLLCDANFHRALLNSRMLELMDIDKNTPYNENSFANYGRDENGEPDGFAYERVFEFNKDIDRMYEKIGWWPPSESDPEVALPVLEDFTSWGVSGICDGFTESEGTLRALKTLEAEGRLNHYYYGMVLMESFGELEKAIATAKEWQKKYGDDYIRIDKLKLFLDGTNEIGTSAVLEPFECDPEGRDCGVMNMTEEQLTDIFCRINQEGLDIQIHLVGDRSFRAAVNATEKAREAELEAGRNFKAKIWLIHCELTKPEDRQRAAELGIHINFTPIWAGGAFGDMAKEYLGEERFRSMYAFNQMLDAGIHVNYSSDVVDNEDFQTASPFLGIEVGHTRKLPWETQMREPAEECISLENMLRGYTIYNAESLGEADRMGSLEPGKLANLNILSGNIFEAPENEIHNIKADIVMFEGKIIR